MVNAPLAMNDLFVALATIEAFASQLLITVSTYRSVLRIVDATVLTWSVVGARRLLHSLLLSRRWLLRAVYRIDQEMWPRTIAKPLRGYCATVYDNKSTSR